MSKIDPSDYSTDEYMVPLPPMPHAGWFGRRLFPLVSGLTRRMTSLLFLLVLLMGGAAFYFYHQLSVLESNPQIQAQREAADLVAQVSKIFLLPTGETPNIATVLDPAKLKDQPFFAHAQKNDRVLMYGNAKEAILYNPATNKVINVAPLVSGDSQANSVPSAPSLNNSPPTTSAPASSTPK